MAYSFQPLEQALDSLGVNYTDGVEVKINEKYTVKYDAAGLEALLNAPHPSSLSLDVSFDGAFERKVVEDLAQYDVEKAKREADQAARLKEYDRRKAEERELKRKKAEERALEDERLRLEELEAEKRKRAELAEKVAAELEKAAAERKRVEEEQQRREEEEEWQRFERERQQNELLPAVEEPSKAVHDESGTRIQAPGEEPPGERKGSPAGGEGGEECGVMPEVANKVPASVSPVALNSNSVQPASYSQEKIKGIDEKPTTEIDVKGTKSNRSPVKINFSDFEAEADPFADLELKSINDLAELQTILTPNNRVNTTGPMNGYSHHNGVNLSAQGMVGSAHTAQPESQQHGQTDFLPSHTQPYSGVGGYGGPGSYYSGNSSGVPQGSVTSSSPFSFLQKAHGNPNFVDNRIYYGVHQPSLPGPGPGYRPGPPPTSTPATPGYPVPPLTSTVTSAAYHLPPSYSSSNSYSSSASYCPTSGSQQHPYNGLASNGAYTTNLSHPKSSSTTSSSSSHQLGQSKPSCSLSYSGGSGLSQQQQPLPPPPHDVYRRHQPQSDGGGAAQQPLQREATAGRSLSSDRRQAHLKKVDEEKVEKSADVGELKSSRSVGDIITELQREAQLLADHKRKSVHTPPPRPTTAGRSSGLEDWVPWPQLGPSDPLVELGEKEKTMCSQLGEMGFPLSRLAMVARTEGADSQKLINFCVIVDRFVEEGVESSLAEEVALLHTSEQKLCRKHIAAFGKLAELGFPRKDIHAALVHSGLDYQKALEKLIN